MTKLDRVLEATNLAGNLFLAAIAGFFGGLAFLLLGALTVGLYAGLAYGAIAALVLGATAYRLLRKLDRWMRDKVKRKAVADTLEKYPETPVSEALKEQMPTDSRSPQYKQPPR